MGYDSCKWVLARAIKPVVQYCMQVPTCASFKNMKLLQLIIAIIAYLLLTAGVSALAQAEPLSSPAATATPAIAAEPASKVIERMLARNGALESYTSRVHVNLRMLNFPFLSPQLDGTSYYKHPNKYEVVFDRVPSYAKGFEKIFNDAADPGSWPAEWDVTNRGLVKLDGFDHPLVQLSMTKKIYSTITKDAIAYVDPQNLELVQMVWEYRSGGKIVLRQWYREQGQYSLVSQQHVDISIPHVRAVGDSQFGVYQTNVALSDGVFKQ